MLREILCRSFRVILVFAELLRLFLGRGCVTGFPILTLCSQIRKSRNQRSIAYGAPHGTTPFSPEMPHFCSYFRSCCCVCSIAVSTGNLGLSTGYNTTSLRAPSVIPLSSNSAHSYAAGRGAAGGAVGRIGIERLWAFLYFCFRFFAGSRISTTRGPKHKALCVGYSRG
jgi:hypothetical protein